MRYGIAKNEPINCEIFIFIRFVLINVRSLLKIFGFKRFTVSVQKNAKGNGIVFEKKGLCY
jgi:hypothetical protein